MTKMFVILLGVLLTSNVESAPDKSSLKFVMTRDPMCYELLKDFLVPELLDRCTNYKEITTIKKVGNDHDVDTALCLLYYNNFMYLCGVLKQTSFYLPEQYIKSELGKELNKSSVCSLFKSNNFTYLPEKVVVPGIINEMQREEICGKVCVDYDGNVSPMCQMISHLVQATIATYKADNQASEAKQPSNGTLTSTYARPNVSDIKHVQMVPDPTKQHEGSAKEFNFISSSTEKSIQISEKPKVEGNVEHLPQSGFSREAPKMVPSDYVENGQDSQTNTLPLAPPKTDPKHPPGGVLKEPSETDSKGTSGVDTKGISGIESKGPSAGDSKEPSAVDSKGPPAVDSKGASAVDSKGPSAVDSKGPSAVDSKGHSAVDSKGPSAAESKGPSAVDSKGSSVVDSKGPSTVDSKRPSKPNPKNTAETDPKGPSKTDDSNKPPEVNLEPSKKNQATHEDVQPPQKETDIDGADDEHQLPDPEEENNFEANEGDTDYDNNDPPKPSEEKPPSKGDTYNTGVLPEEGADFRNQKIDDGDSYFVSYFMMVCVLFIGGYLVFHNKQKILAIVLEGRKGRRSSRSRRPNSANYRKLDSNLEEAMTSSCSKNTTQVIY